MVDDKRTGTHSIQIVHNLKRNPHFMINLREDGKYFSVHLLREKGFYLL
jgi:hypothetical protein